MPQTPVTHKEFRSFTRKLVVFCVIISLGCAGGFYAIKHESNTRTNQFCALNVARANDSVKQFDTTIEYLRSPAGQENTGINNIIRERSVPALGKEVKFNETHKAAICLDSGFVYQVTKYPGALDKATAPPPSPVLHKPVN